MAKQLELQVMKIADRIGKIDFSDFWFSEFVPVNVWQEKGKRLK